LQTVSFRVILRAMSLKSAACLALAGTSLVTIVLLVHLVQDGWGFFNNVAAATRLGASIIRSFAGVSVSMFLYTFYKKQA
jgi:hypothetical protein